MKQEYVISDEALEIIHSAINRGENWMAYNYSLYFIDKQDVQFFRNRKEAEEFASDNFSDFDRYNVIQVQSIADVLRQMPYGENINERLADPDANGLYTRHGNAFTDALIDHTEQQQLLKNSKQNVMNEKNLEYLKENLKYSGFADKLNEQLETEIKKQQPEFTLKLETEVNKQPVKAELYFKMSNESDMYFFNKYGVEIKNEKDNQPLTQTFYLNQGRGVTLKEAYNLLQGRAVHKELENKEGEKYKAWIKLDFGEKDAQGNFKRQQFHENYGYNVADALAKYPIKELLDEKLKDELVKSIHKGNVQAVTFEKNGIAEKLFVEANPQFKSVNVYDMKMQRIEKQELAERYGLGMNGKEQGSSQAAGQSMKHDKGDEETGEQKQGKKRSRKKGQSMA